MRSCRCISVQAMEQRRIMRDFVILGNVSDDPFAIDLGYLCGQTQEISDLISLKVYANSEFCPRFISDEHDLEQLRFVRLQIRNDANLFEHLRRQVLRFVDDEHGAAVNGPQREEKIVQRAD